MFRRSAVALAVACSFALPAAQAQIALIAKGSIAGNASDLSGLTGSLENGVAANRLGGLGSGQPLGV